MKLRVFVLEDEIDRYPRNQIVTALKSHDLTIAKSCEEAKKKFEAGIGKGYDLLLLDHDMEGNYEYRPDYPNTGMQFVKWLVDKFEEWGIDDDHPEVIIHSQNHVGAKNMSSYLKQGGFPSVHEFPFDQNYVKSLKEIG